MLLAVLNCLKHGYAQLCLYEKTTVVKVFNTLPMLLASKNIYVKLQ